MIYLIDFRVQMKFIFLLIRRIFIPDTFVLFCNSDKAVYSHCVKALKSTFDQYKDAGATQTQSQ